MKDTDRHVTSAATPSAPVPLQLRSNTPPSPPLPPPEVWLIVLNWNGKDDTLRCLASLRQLTYPNFRVCVVDNGSSDDSVEVISSCFPEVKLIPVGRNLGYAGGNNVGMKSAIEHGASYVLVLNNDTVVAPDMLEWLVDAAVTSAHVGAVGAKIYYMDRPNVIWSAGSRWQNDIRRFVLSGYESLDLEPGSTDITETDYACGCAFLAHVSVLARVGLFDEAYFLNFEESDWCARARRMGLRMYLASGAKLWHRGSASFGGGESPLHAYFMTRNRLLWIERHIGLRAALAELWTEIRWLLNVVGREMRFVGDGESATFRSAYWRLRSLPRRFGYQFSNPHFRVKVLALRDYVTRRFGDCPEGVRMLRKRSGDA